MQCLVTLRHSLAILVLGVAIAFGAAPAGASEPVGIVVYQSDFGLKDGAVSAMRGVARTVDRDLLLENLTHEIPPFNIWEGAYRLNTTAPYWPPGTVFVSVVDPGVGTDRKSVVLLTKSGHYFVSPDNGTLTLVADTLGIEAVREIDESRYRLPGSEASYTFHGRDVYSYAAAHIASGTATFEQIGPLLEPNVFHLDYQAADLRGDSVAGTIPILDVQYGNVWTNIDRATFAKLGVELGTPIAVRIYEGETLVYDAKIPFVSTFGDVPQDDPLAYLNSVNNLSFAINWGDFAGTHGVSSGPEWRVEVGKP
ncbi:MAG: S-adenosyl-l-methionine hydroxide adenosyltransferase family protein [Inquilinus sp.]|nr:S-adenosyl-l-methionine hydroxide adenosyltransferase family protein [Inquilinus sp.]